MTIFQQAKKCPMAARMYRLASGRMMRLPRIWLMTDERMGGGILPAIRRLPRGSGILFRHYSLPPARRRALFMAIRRIARRRGHVILVAGPPKLARDWGADGYHGHFAKITSSIHHNASQICSVPAHNVQEICRRSPAADVIFLSPVYATVSHPGARPLGPAHFRQLSQICRRKSAGHIIALGGMTRTKFEQQCGGQIHGWAAITALSQWHRGAPVKRQAN